MRRMTRLALVLLLLPSVSAMAKSAPDIEVKRLEDLACSSSAAPARQACEIAKAFASAGAPADVSAGKEQADQAWVGHMIEIRLDHGRPAETRTNFFFLRTTRDAGGNRRAFWNGVTPDDAAEARQIEASIATLAAGHPSAPGDKLAAFVTTSMPLHGWQPLLPTQGPSLLLRDGEHGQGYLRATAGRRLALITDTGDFDNSYATYVELWPVTAASRP